MLKQLRIIMNELHIFLVLWSTQPLSALGSSMTNFALVVWSYQKTGSALTTSLLSICSYAPYVLLSMFAGALSDKWDKKVTMLVSDSFAALSTIVVLGLLKTGHLEIWHLYFFECAERFDEYDPAAGIGCGNQSADTEETLSEGQRDAFVFQLAGYAPDADSGSDLVPGCYQPDGVDLQCGTSCHAALTDRRRGACSRNSEYLYWYCHGSWKHPGICDACTPKPDQSHLQYPVIFYEHRKLYSGVWQERAGVVYGSDAWMDRYPHDERKYGCDSQESYSGGDAGACLFSEKYITIFHDSGRISAWRHPG